MNTLEHYVYIVGKIILHMKKSHFKTGKQTGNLWQQIAEM